MKAGDLITLCKMNYPQYTGQSGILVRQDRHQTSSNGRCWVVMIDGRVHPYFIDTADVRVIA